MKWIYCVLVLLCSYMSKAQQPVKIGETLPALAFTNMYNYPAKQLNIKDLKAKLILLDFWATWCGNCLTKFNLLDSLRLAHNGALEVVLVNSVGTNDDLTRVNKTFTRLNKVRPAKLSLPVALHDIKAKKLFPHKSLPHYVWLDENKRVVAITGGESVTTENIAAAIKGDYRGLVIKAVDASFNIRQPFLLNKAFDKDDLLYSSSLTGSIKGLSSPAYTNEANGQVSVLRYVNKSLRSLLFYAHHVLPPKNRVIIEATAHAALSNQKYCYELITPLITVQRARALMQDDLEKYFKVKAKEELRMTAVYVLKADTMLLKKLISKAGPSSNSLNETGNRLLQNRGIDNLVEWLNRYMDLPVLDETGFLSMLDMDLPEPDFSLPAMSQLLQPFGLRLERVERSVNCFIIY